MNPVGTGCGVTSFHDDGAATMKVEINQRHIVRLLIALPILMLLGGCTTQTWYEGVKISAENECNKQPPGAAADCLARLNRKPYEAYEKERTSK